MLLEADPNRSNHWLCDDITLMIRHDTRNKTAQVSDLFYTISQKRISFDHYQQHTRTVDPNATATSFRMNAAKYMTRRIVGRVHQQSSSKAFGSSQIRRSRYHTTSRILSQNEHQWADPQVREYRYWNREETKDQGRYSFLIEISPDSIKKEARILSLASADDLASKALHEGVLPTGAHLLGVGESLQDLEKLEASSTANTLFVSPSCPNASEQVPAILKAIPSIEWVHVRSAGIDFVVSEELNEFRESIHFTNAKVSRDRFFGINISTVVHNRRNRIIRPRLTAISFFCVKHSTCFPYVFFWIISCRVNSVRPCPNTS